MDELTTKRGRPANLWHEETATEIRKETIPLLTAKKKALERLLNCLSTINTMICEGCRYRDVVSGVNGCTTKVISTEGIIAYGEEFESTSVIRIYGRVRRWGLLGYVDYTLHLKGLTIAEETRTDENNINEEARIYRELKEIEAKIRHNNAEIEERKRIKEEEKARRLEEQKRKREERTRIKKEEIARRREERIANKEKRSSIKAQFCELKAKKKEIWEKYKSDISKINKMIEELEKELEKD